MARQPDKYCADGSPTFAFIDGHSMPTGNPTIWRKRKAIAIVSVQLFDVVAWCSAVTNAAFLEVDFEVIFSTGRLTESRICWRSGAAAG
jgi:hypothetical protein